MNADTNPEAATAAPTEGARPADTAGKTSVRSWTRRFLRASYGTPVLVFILTRLNEAGFFLWGAINKAPWNAWGCAGPGMPGYSSLAPGDCYTSILQLEAQYMPFGTGSIITQHVLPNVLPFEWFTFILEMTLAITLGLGILTRLFALAGTLWATFIIAQYVWIPGPAFPDSAAFILAPLLIVTIYGGQALTVDSLLRPRLERSQNPVARFLVKCMFGPLPGPSTPQ
jgi:uncharacterized membrane protein YphA (DoxX/SURF4 family)